MIITSERPAVGQNVSRRLSVLTDEEINIKAVRW